MRQRETPRRVSGDRAQSCKVLRLGGALGAMIRREARPIAVDGERLDERCFAHDLPNALTSNALEWIPRWWRSGLPKFGFSEAEGRNLFSLGG